MLVDRGVYEKVNWRKIPITLTTSSVCTLLVDGRLFGSWDSRISILRIARHPTNKADWPVRSLITFDKTTPRHQSRCGEELRRTIREQQSGLMNYTAMITG